MFIAGKILSLLTQPLAWIVVLLSLCLWTLPRRPQRARALLAFSVGLLLALGWVPAPNTLLQQLESQFTEWDPQADLGGYAGMVVLGGGLEQAYIAQDHRQSLLNDGAERMVAAVAAMQRQPALRVLFTGGEGGLIAHGPSEAQRAQVFFDSLGVAPARVLYESASRTTHENAVLCAQLPSVNPQERWLLVTSAWHMPRAMGTFRAAGWNVHAYPVDFRSAHSTPWTEYSLRDGLARWQLALHELLGTLYYRLAGWI